MECRYALLILIIVIISAVGAAAKEETLFSSWKFPAETLTVNDEVYSYVWRDSVSSLRLRYGAHYETINEGECEVLRGTNDTVKFCYDKNEYDMSKREFKAYLRIFSLEPDIVVEREFSDTDLVIGETARVDVKLTNEGESVAYDISYKDVLEGFEIVKCDECRVNGNIVENEISYIDAGEFSEFSYEIRPVERLDSKLSAVIDYKSLAASESIVTRLIAVKAVPVIEVNTKIVDPDYYASDINDIIVSGQSYIKKGSTTSILGEREVSAGELDTFRVGDDFKLIVELLNNMYGKKDGDRIDVESVDIKFHHNLGNEKVSNVRAKYNATLDRSVGERYISFEDKGFFRWSGRLDEQRTYLVLSMEAQKTGFPEIFIFSDYDFRGEEFHSEHIIRDINIVNVSPVVTVGFEKRDPWTKSYTRIDYLDPSYTSESGKEEIMKVRVNNPSFDTYMKNVDIVLDSPALEKQMTYHIDSLEAVSSRLLERVDVRMPYVNKTVTYNFYLNMSWDSEFGEHFESSKKYRIKVEQIKDIDIYRKFSKKSVHSGEEFEVTVSVENKRPTALKDVSITEDYDGLIFKRGLSSQLTNIRANSKIDAYKYILAAPAVDNLTDFCINTTVSYPEGDEHLQFHDQGCITVIPKYIDLDVLPEPEMRKVHVGDIFGIDYRIKNDDDESAYDLWFKYPLSKEVDFIGEYVSARFPELDEDEIWNVGGVFRVRFKKEGKIQVPSISLNYKDKNSIDYEFESGKTTITVEPQNVYSPMLVISKNISSDKILVNSSINVTIVVKNIGEGFATDIAVYDGNETWEIDKVGKGDRKIIRYEMEFDEAEEVDLGRALMTYSDGIWEYRTVSELRTLAVLLEPEIEEFEYTIVEEKREEPVQEEKNIFVRIMEWVYKILFWQKGGGNNGP